MPELRAVIFILLGGAAGFGFFLGLKNGVAGTNGIWDFGVATNPPGYVTAMAMKLGFVAFGFAELLYLAGLIGDPWNTVAGFMQNVGYHSSYGPRYD